MAKPWAALLVPSQLDGPRLQILLDALTAWDVLYLRENPGTPELYKSGVRYREEDGREEWLEIPHVLDRWRRKREGSDCEDLCAWRAAELQIRGERARCTWAAYREPDSLTYHIRVRRGDGSLEDPSEILGMGRPLSLVGGSSRWPSVPYFYR